MNEEEGEIPQPEGEVFNEGMGEGSDAMGMEENAEFSRKIIMSKIIRKRDGRSRWRFSTA
jgi:hypothetical protein